MCCYDPGVLWTGWKMTDSPSSILDEFVVGVSISVMLLCRCMLINSSAVVQFFFW